MADMTTQAIRIAEKIWPDNGVTIRVRNTRKGYGYPATREVTIPVWVMRGHGKAARPGYTKYYIAHELAHVHSGDIGHGVDFYESFTKLCPKSYHRFELQYKPRSAKSAGITR